MKSAHLKFTFSCILVFDAAISQVPSAFSDVGTATSIGGRFGTDYPQQEESESVGLPPMPTRHHRLGNDTTFSNSAVQTATPTSEGEKPTGIEPNARMEQPSALVIPRVRPKFPSFSERLLITPVIRPTIESPPALSQIRSPGMSLGEVSPGGRTMSKYENENDLEGFSEIEWGHGENRGPFSLQQIMK